MVEGSMWQAVVEEILCLLDRRLELRVVAGGRIFVDSEAVPWCSGFSGGFERVQPRVGGALHLGVSRKASCLFVCTLNQLLAFGRLYFSARRAPSRHLGRCGCERFSIGVADL